MLTGIMIEIVFAIITNSAVPIAMGMIGSL
jgi:hypothetical protein